MNTRKSTSGGVLCVASCTIKHWSFAQEAIALSSAEAALSAATQAISEAKGVKYFGQRFGENLRIAAWVDVDATFGLSCTSGVGKAHHIETIELWMQAFQERGESELRKVNGGHQPADMFTKPMPWGCHDVQSASNPKGGIDRGCAFVGGPVRHTPHDIPAACARRAVCREHGVSANVR